MDPIIERMQQTLTQQRRAFAASPFPAFANRRDKLKSLRRILQRYQDRIVDAVSADFGGRAATETKFSDVLGPILEINHAIRSLRRWMRPRRRHTESLFLTNRVWINYQPKGVVGVIAPWNFPLYLSLGPLIAALAAGNRAMIKMSELSPHSTELLVQMIGECFPEDEVAVFGGQVEAAQAFSGLPFDHLVFTGSPAVGRHVMRAAADNLTPVTLELGGKSPALVSGRESLARAALSIAHGKAVNSGQICVAPDYALVPREDVATFATAVAEAFHRMYPGVQGNRDYTSIASDAHAKRIRELLADARAKGGNVVACGDEGTGRQIPLYVVTNVRDDMRIASEEVFGPILPVIGCNSLDEAVAYISVRPRPLALYPFGFGREELAHILRATHSGGVSVDDWGWQVFNHDLPFGGIGNSGMGTYHGDEGFRELSHAKAVFKRNRLFPVALFYPPYGNLAQRLVLKLYVGDPDPSVSTAPPGSGSAPPRRRRPASTDPDGL
jgi:coniferyl-aldehyde dehydrogenase